MTVKEKAVLASVRQKAQEAQKTLWTLQSELLELKRETEEKMDDIYSRISKVALTLGE